MTLLDKAIVFAVKAHSGAFRKGTKIPYIVHPMETATIAASMTDDEEVIAAAVLHDVVEDTPVTKKQLEVDFGARVASLVCADSEDKCEYLPSAQTWEIRKQETLDYVPKASHDEQIIILADKLSNLRAIYRDVTLIGDKVWNKFNVKDKSKHKWYYCGVANALSDKIKATATFQNYAELLEKVFC